MSDRYVPNGPRRQRALAEVTDHFIAAAARWQRDINYIGVDAVDEWLEIARECWDTVSDGEGGAP